MKKSPGTCPGLLYCSEAVSVSGSDRAAVAPAELEVEAGFDHALALLDVEVGECCSIGQADVAGAEVVVVVFDEAGEPIQERIFAADADGPAAARLAAGHGKIGRAHV